MSAGPPAGLHHGRYGPEGPLRRAVQKTAENPQLEFINKVVFIPVDLQRWIPWCDCSRGPLRFLFARRQGGRYPCCAGRSSSWLSPYSAQCLVRHWIHAVWYVAMCVSTAPVAEPIVMSFTVPWIVRTIVATAYVVTSFSSADCPDCCRSVYVAMSCGGGFFHS